MADKAQVLITCTQPRADEIASSFGNYAITNPALTVQKLNVSCPVGHYDSMVITSRHALNHDLPQLPTICVGHETAAIARSKNLDVVDVGSGGIQDLALSPYKNILYPCAVDPSFIPENCTPWPVYKTLPNPYFNIDESVTHIAIFSNKAAKVIKSYDLHNKIILTLSQKIADVLNDTMVKKLVICTHPNYDIMKTLIEKELEKHT